MYVSRQCLLLLGRTAVRTGIYALAHPAWFERGPILSHMHVIV
jgi:hypothetical protein